MQIPCACRALALSLVALALAGPAAAQRAALLVVRRYLLPARRGGPGPRVTLETERGPLVVELLPVEAPLTVAAFLSLVDRRYFDGSAWHRVVPNFVVQDGDPRGDGWGGPGFAVRDETNPMRYETGTVGMALSGPDTGGSQFFITILRSPIWTAPTRCSVAWFRGWERSRPSGRASASGASTDDCVRV